MAEEDYWEEEMYRPRIYKRITPRGGVELTVDDYNLGYLSVEILPAEGFCFVYDYETDVALTFPPELYEEAKEAETEEELWKVWEKIEERNVKAVGEEQFKKKLFEFLRDLYAERVRAVMEIMDRALRGEEVRISADMSSLEERLKKGEIENPRVKAVTEGFWLIWGKGGKEERKFFSAPDLFKLLFDVKAESVEREEERLSYLSGG